MNRFLSGVVVPFILIFLPACGLKDISRQIDTVDNVGVIKGKVDVQTAQKGPVVVLRFEVVDNVFMLDNQLIASGAGNYEFTVEPGEYLVAAFVDVNRDGRFQRGQEHGNFSTDPLTFTVGERETIELQTIVIRGDPPVLADGQRAIIAEPGINRNIGKVVSLDEPQFTRDNYSMGMWRPLDFLASVEGGLMFLQEYDPSKVPVIFVHGIAGGPTDLRKLIESLDEEKFQAWVLYYPSGVRLDMVSDYMVKAVTDLQNEYGFKHFDVIAHSMGGLVVRSFVRKYVERFPLRASQIGLVMTINSPMGGMASASSGVDLSPVVVPAWRDVATDSEFLRDLHDWAWPEQIPYYLVFSHVPESGDDGVVTLESQIPFKLQSEAVRMYGFTNSHVGTLTDPSFITLFGKTLNMRQECAAGSPACP